MIGTFNEETGHVYSDNENDIVVALEEITPTKEK
jgi:hypothetical protein